MEAFKYGALENQDLPNFTKFINICQNLAEKKCRERTKVRFCEIFAAGLWWCRLGGISTLHCWHPGADLFEILEQREMKWAVLKD